MKRAESVSRNVSGITTTPNPKTCINPLLGKWRGSFLVRAKYRSETRLFEAATWQPGEREPSAGRKHPCYHAHTCGLCKIKLYSSFSSASVHHRYGTDSARNAGEVPRISHAPQICGTGDAEVRRSGIAALPPGSCENIVEAASPFGLAMPRIIPGTQINNIAHTLDAGA